MYKKKWLVVPVVSVSFALLLVLGLFLNVIPQETASGETSSLADSNILESLNAAYVEVAKIARPSVVNISTTLSNKRSLEQEQQPRRDPYWDDFFRRFFPEEPRRQQPDMKPSARGSGFIVKEDGYILTNHHVVNNSDKIKVILDDKREFDAELVGTDRESEVAVIKIDAKDLPAVKFGDSDALQVGEMVLAIGNPFALSHTVTNGIVSAIGRSNVLNTVTYQDFIQTNAAINPGNSGGPLVNIRGEVIGINTAIALATTASGVPMRGNVGIGFAIPINMASKVMDDLIATGQVVRGYLGIIFQPGLISKNIAERYGLEEPAGSLIVEIIEGGPAEDARLNEGDLIVEFHGESVRDNAHLQRLVADANPDETVKIKVIRDREKKEFKVKLGERPKQVAVGPRGHGADPHTQEEWLGITVQELTDALSQRFGYEGQAGVLVSSVDPEGPAAELDDPPRSGDLIQEIEFQEIKNLDDYKKVKKDVEDKKSVMMKLRRSGGRPWYVVIKE